MKNELIGLLMASSLFVPSWASAAGDAGAGEAVYNRVCKMCHATGMMGAPKVGDKAAWAPRIEQGDDVLAKHAIEGFGSMPPKGSCKACSDEDIVNAMTYMVKQSQ
jgi:cytochrome c5